MKASEVFQRVQIIIQDVLGVRWPLEELCLWLNDGLRDIVVQKPSSCSRTIKLPIAVGAAQVLPAEFNSILRPIRNVEAGQFGVAVTVVSRELMDAQAPNWYTNRQRKVVKHLMFDEADLRTFYVYPPNDGKGTVEVVVSVFPDVVVATGEPDQPDSYNVEIGMRDEYASPLVDYILYRAYSKDAQNAGAATRASLHYGQYGRALGIQIGVEASMSPNTKARLARGASGVTPE